MTTNIASIMHGYFQEARPAMLSEAFSQSAPIVPKKSEWQQVTDGSALIRTFTLENSNSLAFFVSEVLAMQAELEHHAQILIDGLSVKIRVGTKVLSRVTELDIEYASNVDKIFNDARGQNG